jgi:hypothetical protein
VPLESYVPPGAEPSAFCKRVCLLLLACTIGCQLTSHMGLHCKCVLAVIAHSGCAGGAEVAKRPSASQCTYKEHQEQHLAHRMHCMALRYRSWRGIAKPQKRTSVQP